MSTSMYIIVRRIRCKQGLTNCKQKNPYKTLWMNQLPLTLKNATDFFSFCKPPHTFYYFIRFEHFSRLEFFYILFFTLSYS